MKLFTVLTTEFALEDLKLAQTFYEAQAPQLGDYFFDALLTDIESLHLYAGIHPKKFGYHKMLSKRFPYAIYYSLDEDETIVKVIAVLDQRQHPVSHYTHLSYRD